MHSRLGDIYMELDKLDKALAEYHRWYIFFIGIHRGCRGWLHPAPTE